MAKTKKVPLRSEVRVDDTWDLTILFKNDAAWEKAYKQVTAKVNQFDRFRGKLGKSPKMLKDCYDLQVQFEREAERLGSYAHLKSSEDVANSTYQGMVSKYIHFAMHANEAASFMAPEIQAIPAATMKKFLGSPLLKDYRFALEKLLRYKKHILTEKEERLLAMQGEVAHTPSRVFEQLNDADLKFGFVRNERGEKIELSQSTMMSFMQSPKRAVRQEAFKKFYDVYEAHSNTIAATLSSSVQQDVYYSRVRNYPSCRASALYGDNVPEKVYDNLISTVHDNLDVVYKYLDVRRKALKLKDLHIYDVYVPIEKRARVTIPYEKAATQIVESLAPLGDDYCKTLQKGLLDGRWVDRYENEGKRSGAFSAGGYDGPPYILMNYRDEVIESMYTLAHEAGHSMHSYYSVKNQPFQYYGYTIFVAEVASTFNEQLLTRYLLDRAKDKATKVFLINKEIDEIRGTLIRQTMFAEFEKIIHEIVEGGEPLTLERIRAEYSALLRLYFGPKFAYDDQLSLESLRIPHFYHSFYVYKYATGISAAIALSRKVLNGGAKERDAYLNFLKAGGSKYPLDILREAGVDMAKPEPIQLAMARFKELVDELAKLV